MQTATSIDDLRDIAKARVPKAFFEYADHGSYSQSTMRANRSDLQAIGLRQRVAIDVDKRDLQTTIAGIPAKLPLALAPIGRWGQGREAVWREYPLSWSVSRVYRRRWQRVDAVRLLGGLTDLRASSTANKSHDRHIRRRLSERVLSLCPVGHRCWLPFANGNQHR